MVEALRVAVVVLGGMSFGVAVSILRHMNAYMPRDQLFAIRMMVAIHLAVVLFIAGVLAERSGEPISWYTPAAAAIFGAKLVVMLSVREVVRAQHRQADPPSRRVDDRDARHESRR